MDTGTLILNNQFNLDSHVEQVILVTAMPGALSGYLYAFQKNADGKYDQVFETMPVVIGRDGMTPDKHEGDDKSPLGLHKIGHAFGNGPKPSFVDFPYKEISANDKFVDDPNSPEYNTWVRGETKAKSYERMRRKDETYDLGMIIEYNMHPVVPGKGSAIFLHIWKSSDRGTQGCVAMKRSNLEMIMKWLKPKFNPHLYILES